MSESNDWLHDLQMATANLPTMSVYTVDSDESGASPQGRQLHAHLTAAFKVVMGLLSMDPGIAFPPPPLL